MNLWLLLGASHLTLASLVWWVARRRLIRRVAESEARVAEEQTTTSRVAAEVARVRVQVMTKATRSQNERDAAVQQRTELLVGLGKLSESLKQGAHVLAAERLERFVNDHLDRGQVHARKATE